MRFLLANEKLVVAGRSFPGFPLLLDDDGRAMEPAQTFLWWLLTKPGRTESKKTWVAYGRAMYDYFGFVNRNKIDWKAAPMSGMPGAIEAYRDWSKGTLDLASNTINQRLRIVVRFYEWAQKQGHIEKLPFDHVSVRTGMPPRFLAHVDMTGGRMESPDILLREKKQTIKFLTKEQVSACLAQITNDTHRFMFGLMVRAGLRQIECRTFPGKYLFDPRRRPDLVEGQKIRLALDPRDMKLKLDKPREIDMPYDMMEDLWWYAARHRQRRERNRRDGKKYPVLFLTEAGEPYGETSLTQVFASLSSRVGFPVHPHMLRHTYATYLLWSLRKSANFQGEPLLYVRDRLGHSDVSTTAIYLHLINSLEAQLALAHEDELDTLFAAKGRTDGTTEEI